MINFDDFKKLDLRVARIVSAERVENTDKLLRLVLDVGGEERQIVSGIAEQYLPEDLVGREIVIVANLEPRKFTLRRGRGQEVIDSNGMLLAAGGENGEISLLRPDKEMPPGAPVH
ncbi:MAG: methionine--tRNA ligase subunit beta [Candidatus Jorgensenbacteria bacterium]